jgi:hypothetical protein
MSTEIKPLAELSCLLPYCEASPKFKWLFERAVELGVIICSRDAKTLKKANKTGNLAGVGDPAGDIFGNFEDIFAGTCSVDEALTIAHELAHATDEKMTEHKSEYEAESHAYGTQHTVYEEFKLAGLEPIFDSYTDEEIRELHPDVPYSEAEVH